MFDPPYNPGDEETAPEEYPLSGYGISQCLGDNAVKAVSQNNESEEGQQTDDQEKWANFEALMAPDTSKRGVTLQKVFEGLDEKVTAAIAGCKGLTHPSGCPSRLHRSCGMMGSRLGFPLETGRYTG